MITTFQQRILQQQSLEASGDISWLLPIKHCCIVSASATASLPGLEENNAK